MRWTLLDCPALVEIEGAVLEGMYAPMQAVGDVLPDHFAFPRNVIVRCFSFWL